MNRWLVVLVSAAALATSCSASGPVVGAPTVVEQAPSPAVDATEQPTPEDLAFEPAGIPGGVLRLALMGNPIVDPALASPVSPTDMVLADLLYDGLTSWDVNESTWAPSLGATFVESGDGLVWTVELVDATFSDQMPITAVDVKRSFDRVLSGDPTLQSNRLDVLTEVVVVDDSTVRFVLAHPFALFPALLSSPIFGIVPEGDPTGLVGSGPLHLVTPTQLRPPVTLEGDGGVELDFLGVDLVLVDTHEEAAGLRATGEVDLAFVGSSYTGSVDRLVDSAVEAHFALNVSAAELVDPEVRRGLLAAVDPAATVDEWLGDAALPIDRLSPNASSCADRCGRGLAGPEALASLDRLSVAVVEVPDGDELRLARALAAQLARAGADAEAVGYGLDDFVGVIGAGIHDVVRTGWIGLFPSADSQLAPYRTSSPDNVSGYSSVEFDTALAVARASGSDADYAVAAEVLERDAVVLPLARLQIRALVSDAVAELDLRHDGSFDAESLVVYQ